MDLTAAENLTVADLSPFWSRGVLSPRAERRKVNELLADLDVRPAQSASLPLRSFSGGNQQKLVLGRWLRTFPKVLLLDDPTQGVDVGAKAGLHRQILGVREHKTAVIISSTDEDELVTLCDRVIIMNRGINAAQLSGDEVTAANITRSFHEVDRLAVTDVQLLESKQI